MDFTAWGEVARAWLPALICVLVSFVVLATTKRILRRAEDGEHDGGSIVRHQLLTLVLYGAAVVAFVLTLPIEDGSRGQLLSLLGLLVTAAIALSSTTFVGNVMAGLMLRALGNFRPGDFVRVGEQFGRVSEQGILHTEIQTEDRDLTTLPNLHLVTKPITVVRASGTVVSASLSLGYDICHTDIEQALLRAAEKTGLGDPFVRVISLGDYSVTYRVSGFLKEVKYLLTVRSQLRAHVLDCLHESSIEIVSPTFINQRVYAHDSQFVPELDTPGRRVRRAVSLPEPKIFDKAEEAETQAQLREHLKQATKEVERLQAAFGEAESEEDRQRLLKELERAQSQRDELAKRIS